MRFYLIFSPSRNTNQITKTYNINYSVDEDGIAFNAGDRENIWVYGMPLIMYTVATSKYSSRVHLIVIYSSYVLLEKRAYQL